MGCRTRFRDIPQPFICGVLIDDARPEGVLRTMKLAEYEGATAFDLELQALDPACRNRAALEPVFDNATRPMFTVYRRYVFDGSTPVYVESDEERRMQTQLELIDVGSMGFDMELDTFDPRPAPRRSHRRRASDAVRPLVATTRGQHQPTGSRAPGAPDRRGASARRRGARVEPRPRPTDTRASLQIGRLAEERGADAVKIVQFCASDDDVVEALASTVRLKRELRIPFVMMAMGEYGKLVRTMAPLLGSMLVFARQDYTPGSFLDQPPIRAMRDLFGSVDFRISRRAEWFLPPERR